MQIHVENLRKEFGTTTAVDHVDFSFGSGQIFGFIGPNGAGKTTTMRIIATLDEPTQGRVMLDDINVSEDPEKARRLIGYMPDNLPTHRDTTVHEYLDFFARAYGLQGKQRRGMVEEIEGFTNLLGIRQKAVSALSKGMKQRVSLARALIHDPPLLIMDEPAAGLDPRARVELRELLKVLAGQGKAILISSHILTELSEIITGAVIIEKGQVLRAGTLEEMMHAPRTAGVDGQIAAAPVNLRLIHVRSRSRQDELLRTVLEMPKVHDARAEGDGVEAQVEGDEDDCCDVLAELLKREFRILEFKQVKADLEHIFMNVTRGEVQ